MIGQTLVIFGPSEVPTPLKKVCPTARPAQLDGIRLGFLDDAKPNPDRTFCRPEDQLRGVHSLVIPAFGHTQSVIHRMDFPSPTERDSEYS